VLTCRPSAGINADVGTDKPKSVKKRTKKAT